MAKKRKKQPRREFTKRQLSQWQRQKRIRRITIIAGISVLVAVLGIMLGGWYWTALRPLQQTVLEVNGTRFSMDYYVKMLDYIAKGQSTANLSLYANYTASLIEQDELIWQGAQQLGITVTDSDIKAELSKVNLSNDYRDLARTQLLVDKLKTNDYFTSKVAMTVPQADILAMFLESEQQATELRDQIVNDANPDQKFNDLAASQSLDSYTQQNKGVLGWHPQDIIQSLVGSSVPGDYAFSSDITAQTLSQPRPDDSSSKSVGYWIVEVLEKKTVDGSDQAHVEAMLLGNQQQAEDMISQLQAGTDWATLAKQYSQYTGAKDNGGDLGFVSKGSLPTALDNVIFTMDLNKVSSPIKDDTQTTTGGYWLIKVADKSDSKDLSTDDYSYEINQQLDAWLMVLQSTAAITNSFSNNPALLQFAVNKATKDLQA
jgi:parvulin-like peptidyl-prolyl isomerase